MAKGFISGVMLLTILSSFTMFILDKITNNVKSNVLHNYFCARKDPSFNISVQYDRDNITTLNKYGTDQEYNYKEFVTRLEKLPKNGFLEMVLEKVKKKERFNLRIDKKAKICGVYGENSTCKEAYSFMGEADNPSLWGLLTSTEIGWSEGGEQDEDLVYALLHLFIMGYMRYYTFLMYSNFIIISNLKGEVVFRLDINYKKIFGIDIPTKKNLLLGEIAIAGDYLLIRKFGDIEMERFNIEILKSFNNSIAKNLGKELDIKIGECLFDKDLPSVKEQLDIKSIKEDKDFMDLLSKVKTSEKLMAMIKSKKR